MRFTKITAVTATAVLAAAVAMASSAQANTIHNGVVEAQEFGLYYSPGSNGTWVLDSSGAEDDLSNNVFPGTNTSADNNTASYRNRSWNKWYVYTGAQETGTVGCIPPQYVGDASITFRNRISSTHWSNLQTCA